MFDDRISVNASNVAAVVIIDAVKDAVDGGYEQDLGEYLDDLNNLGCPINQKGERMFPLPE